MSHRRSVVTENAPLTAFTERAQLIDDVNGADTLRVESLTTLRLAMAELSAQIASTDVKQLALACGASQRAIDETNSSEPHVATTIEELRERIAEGITRLQAAKAQVSANRGKLLEARQAVAATTPLDRFLNGPDAVTFAGQLPEKLERALQLAHARLSDLMGHVDELRAKAPNSSGGDGAAAPALTLEEARLKIEAQVGPAHDALRKDIDTQHRRIRALKARLEEVHKTVSPLRRQASPNRTEGAPTSDAARLQALRDELERYRAKQAQLRKLQWAYLVSQPTNMANLRGGKPLERVGEAMAFLKSTVIHFGQDLRKIKAVLRQASFDKEQVFKQAHNELKLVVGLMLPKEEQLRFQRTHHEPWPVTDQLIETKFPAHKLDTSYAALQEMVVSWDAMTEDERQRLTTAHDVVANAEVLYVLARYVAHEWREKRVQMKIRVSGIA